MELPKFKYHPDPIASEVIVKSDVECKSCGKVRGYIYTGPVYSKENLHGQICPWCIADGSAHEKFDAKFTAYDYIGNFGEWEPVSKEIKDEVAFRTPGFSGWQQEKWWTHCNDAAAFIGLTGMDKINKLPGDVIAELRKADDNEDSLYDDDYERLSEIDSPTAYIFKCLHCGKYGGYTDRD